MLQLYCSDRYQEVQCCSCTVVTDIETFGAAAVLNDRDLEVQHCSCTVVTDIENKGGGSS